MLQYCHHFTDIDSTMTIIHHQSASIGSLATWRLKLATPMRICRAKTSIIRALLADTSRGASFSTKKWGKPRNHGKTPWKHRILWASNWHNLETWWENYGLNLKKQMDNHGNTQGLKNWNIRNWDDLFVCPEMVYMKRQFLEIKNLKSWESNAGIMGV